MSKSLKRVTRAIQAAGLGTTPFETGPATTAQMAADLVGCDLNQIAKSVIFRGQNSDSAILFVTAGGNQVNPHRAAALADEPLGKADAAFIRATTGFAIGGVSPLGHMIPSLSFFDRTLLNYETIWAAAGTPRHLFASNPANLCATIDAQTSDFIS